MLNKTLLGSAAVIMTMVGAQAADLPSKKAAPATYVKICDTYGAGFFFIPGTDTCVKLGGYTRYELQYTPAKAISAVTLTSQSSQTVAVTQYANTLDTYGTEYRGTIYVDARTPTAMGVARSYIALRGTGTTGLRKSAPDYTAGTVPNVLSSTNADLTMERAFVQWAGFTMGLATSNYAMIPSMTYSANLWAGFPNGMRQLSYTAVLGGGFSATVGLEEKQMWNNDAGSTSIGALDATNTIVANIRLDQAWGFAAVHGTVGKATYNNAAAGSTWTDSATTKFGPLAYAAGGTVTAGTNASPRSETVYAIGATAMFNLDMIAKGDKIWLTANYADGLTGALTANPLGNPNATSSGGRTFGGVLRNDSNLVYLGTPTGGVAQYGTTTGWNVGAQMLHYWAPQWRSVFTTAYVELTPPNQVQDTKLAWGKGSVYEVRGSMIYSPVKDFDIGLELQYLKNSSKLQNTANDTSTGATAWKTNGYNGLSNSAFTSKVRVERSF